MTDFPELENAIASNELETARDLLRPLLENHPDNPRIWYYAAKAARNEAQCRYFLEQAVKLDPLFHQAANELHALNPVELPLLEEKVVLATANYASAPRRFGAFLVDTVVLFALNWFFLSTFGGFITNDNLLLTVVLLSPVILHWFYHGYYYQWRGGKTFGGKLFGLRVVRLDKQALGFKDAFMRCVLGYIASGLTLGAGFIWQFFNPQHQAWQDILAETIVVVE